MASNLFSHFDFPGPRPTEALRFPLPGSVNPHLGPKIRKPGRVIELIDRPQGELYVAFGIDVIQHSPGYPVEVPDVDVLIHDDYALSQHSPRQRPNAIHHFAGMSRVVFSYRYDHQVVKDAGKGHVVIHDFRELPLHQWQEDALDRFAHPAIFHRRLAYNRSLVNWVLAMSYTGDVKHGELILERIESRMVAERTFGPAFCRLDISLEYDLSIGRDGDVNGFPANKLDGFASQESCYQHLVEVFRQRQDGSKSSDRVGADSNRNL